MDEVEKVIGAPTDPQPPWAKRDHVVLHGLGPGTLGFLNTTTVKYDAKKQVAWVNGVSLELHGHQIGRETWNSKTAPECYRIREALGAPDRIRSNEGVEQEWLYERWHLSVDVERYPWHFQLGRDQANG